MDKTSRRDIRFEDAQFRKERMEADVIRKRAASGKYTIYLDHESEPRLWEAWRGTNKRWYATNDTDNQTIDATTLKGVEFDLRMGYFNG